MADVLSVLKGAIVDKCKILIECKLCKGPLNTCLCEAKLQQTSRGNGGQPRGNSVSS